MQQDEQQREVLVIRGRLDRTGQFVPRRLGSTFLVREWPHVASSRHMIVLLDSSDRPLVRELALVEEEQNCDVGEPDRFRLTAYVALPVAAASLELRQDDIVLWRVAIPEAPRIDVSIDTPRVTRSEPAHLRLSLSPPGAGAYVQLIYQWGDREFDTVDFLPPAETADVDMRGRPGGERCRFVAIYSNGLRSAAAATPEFSLDPLGPTITILQPAEHALLLVGQPCLLQGQVIDLERADGAQLQQELVWLLDNSQVARGPVSSIDQLAPGTHSIVLRYLGGPGAEAAVTVVVRPSDVRPADDWEPWDSWASDTEARSLR